MTPILSTANNSPVRGNRIQRGFTLLEILLVVSLIALAGAVLIPNMTGLDSRSFSAQVRGASSLLNYARREAVVTGSPAKARLVIRQQEENTALPDLQLVGEWLAGDVGIRFRDSTDREIEVEDNLDITFYPEGGSTGGTLLLNQGDRLVAIDIDPFTGRVATEFLDEDPFR